MNPSADAAFANLSNSIVASADTYVATLDLMGTWSVESVIDMQMIPAGRPELVETTDG